MLWRMEMDAGPHRWVSHGVAASETGSAQAERVVIGNDAAAIAGGDHRRHDKEVLVGSRRSEVLFEQQLKGVSQGLEQPPGAYPVGAVPQLDEAQDLAFQEHCVGDAGEQDPHDYGDLEDADSYNEGQIHVLNPFGWSRAPGWS